MLQYCKLGSTHTRHVRIVTQVQLWRYRAPREALYLGLILWLMAPSVMGQQSDVPPLRIIAIFAHPDDGEAKMGGAAAMWAASGHHVKFVSLTNGDAGHHEMGGGPLASRRRAEAQEAARRLGIEAYTVLDYPDAQLMPSLEARHDVIREIRAWQADIVIGLRNNDYHPDHRNAGQLVMDAAYLVVVPNVVTDVSPLAQNPVFLYMQDGFQRPYPFQHDIVVDVTDYLDQKVDALDAHASQFYEWLPWVDGNLEDIPTSAEARRVYLDERWRSRSPSAPQRAVLEREYGYDTAQAVVHAESFEIAEYGRRPSQQLVKQLLGR